MTTNRTTGLLGLKLFSQDITDRRMKDPTKISEYDLFNERKIMDSVGITKEIKKLDIAINQVSPTSAAGKWYTERLKCLVGNGADEATIATSVFGTVRDVYTRTFDHYLEKGFTLDESEKEALEAAKMIYQEEMKLVDQRYPPRYKDLLKM